MITGVYLPEFNGAVLQCNNLIKNTKNLFNYSILTGTNVNNNNKIFINDVLVTKIYISNTNLLTRFFNIINLVIKLIIKLKNIDIVHIHGFSNRNALIILICFLLNKKVILKLTSNQYDDPSTIKEKSNLNWRIYKLCNSFIGISPVFFKSYKQTGLLTKNFNFIPNGVDLNIYKPVNTNFKNKLRLKYNFIEEDKIIICIGHFSDEKRPLFLYNAWLKLIEKNIFANLLFIGHKKNNFEVNNEIIKFIIADSTKRGVSNFIHLIEETNHVDEYMKISDVFVLPSTREGLPNVLLEAMACSLPCIVNNLEGVTDWLIQDGVNGFLFNTNDSIELINKLTITLTDSSIQTKLGYLARQYVLNNFSNHINSYRIINLYYKLHNNNLNV